jgi:hypothetical protein
MFGNDAAHAIMDARGFPQKRNVLCWELNRG